MTTKRAPALEPSHLKLIKAGLEMRASPEPDGDDLAFMARQLVQATLPHSDPGRVEAFTRTNGNLTLVIRPGWRRVSPNSRRVRRLGLPYGSIPRLVLFWITTEALRTKSPRLELGASLNVFMKQLGLNPATGGGPRGDARRLRDQMERLFRAVISFEVTGEHGQRWLDMQVAPKGELWWDFHEPEQQGLYPSWIELGPDFFRAITAAPVPVNMGALKALKRSPLALDLYAFVAHRAFMATRTGKAQFVTWEQLRGQLGTDYAHLQHFRAKAKAALEKIRVVYPGLKLGRRLGGIEIVPGASAVVPPKPSRRKPPAAVDG